MDKNLEIFLSLIKNNNFKNIHIQNYYNLKIIYTANLNYNLHHTNEVLDYVLHNIDFIVTDSEYNLITYVYKKQILNDVIKEQISKNWENITINYNYIGIYTIFFIYNDIKYYCIKYKIDKFENLPFNFINDSIFINYINPIHKIVSFNKLKYILCYDLSNNIINKKMYDINDPILNFKSFDNLEDTHYKQISMMEKYKKLYHAGYIINFNNKKYLLANNIYDKINSILPKYNNINKIYLELYKNDNLNKIINYITPYGYDILKRINDSMKTISKEYLNIYHLTRKKANPLLYEKMNQMNKKILYELHTIFINTRKNEYIINDFFVDKKSLNVDIVYKYLKKLSIDDIQQIYLERDNLIEITKNILYDKNFKIFFEDCINTKTMSYLLKK
jgi:hypothetical protein